MFNNALKRMRMFFANLVGPKVATPAVGRIAGRFFGERMPFRGLTIDTSSPLITDLTRAALLWRSYERAEHHYILRYLPRNRDVIELGGSIGVVTSAIGQRLEAGRRVRTVEADHRLVRLLENNVQLNGVRDKVEIVKAAVSYAGTTVEFAIGEHNVGGSLAELGGDAEIIKVPAVTLSALLKDFPPGYSIVSDIEGAEWEMFEREGDLLAGAEMVVMELHDGSRGRWQDLLEIIRQDDRFEYIDNYGPVVVFQGGLRQDA
ncbi:MAG: FkbM family methyltransferase [Sphingomonadaceae bacterium]